MTNKYKQRSSEELILEILKVISDEERRAKKTRILKGAYMDWWSFQKYFAKLLEQGFVEKIEDPVFKTIYGLTERGEELKRKLESVEKILGGEK